MNFLNLSDYLQKQLKLKLALNLKLLHRIFEIFEIFELFEFIRFPLKQLKLALKLKLQYRIFEIFELFEIIRFRGFLELRTNRIKKAPRHCRGAFLVVGCSLFVVREAL